MFHIYSIFVSILPKKAPSSLNCVDEGHISSVCYQSVSSVAESCLTLCDPMDGSMPGLPVHHQLQSSLKLLSIELVMLSNYLILCHPLLFSLSIFPSIRVFSNESALCNRWPKYWSFSFTSVLPMNIRDRFPLGWTAWISFQSRDS